MEINKDTTVVVANPAAAGGWVGRQWDWITQQLDTHLPGVPVQRTDCRGHAVEIARRSVWSGKRVLLSLGGDGTHSEVVSGVVKDNPYPGSITVGVLPCGTGGDFRRMLIGSSRLKDHIAQIRHGRSHDIDVGRLRHYNQDGDEVTTLFLNEASFGISGLVCEWLNDSSKWMGSSLSYLVGTLSQLRRHQAPTVRIRVDGQEIGVFTASMVMVSNGQWAGGGMHLAPKARLADAMLDVLVLNEVTFGKGVLRSPRLYMGGLEEAGLARTFRGLKVEAELIKPGDEIVEVDGDTVGRLPFEATVIPGAIKMIGVRPEFL